MTSRTIDINCECCGKYMFSLDPSDRKGIAKDYYCELKKCQEQAVVDKLKNLQKNTMGL